MRLGNLESKECRYAHLDLVLENCKLLTIVGEILFRSRPKRKIAIELHLAGKSRLTFRLTLLRATRNLLSLKLKKLLFDI